MLVPLFGTYDVLYGIWPWIEDQQVKIVFLLIVRLICSFQVSFRFVTLKILFFYERFKLT